MLQEINDVFKNNTMEGYCDAGKKNTLYKLAHHWGQCKVMAFSNISKSVCVCVYVCVCACASLRPVQSEGFL